MVCYSFYYSILIRYIEIYREREISPAYFSAIAELALNVMKSHKHNGELVSRFCFWLQTTIGKKAQSTENKDLEQTVRNEKAKVDTANAAIAQLRIDLQKEQGALKLAQNELLLGVVNTQHVYPIIITRQLQQLRILEVQTQSASWKVNFVNGHTGSVYIKQP